jgi:hypothetical protein
MAPQSDHRDQATRDSITEISANATGVFGERHWTVAQVAEIWNLSKDAVRRMFQNEPGVLVLGNRLSGHKRRYTTLRIPQSVLERVHQRCSIVSY